MKQGDNPNWFANSPLERANIEIDQSETIAAHLKDEKSALVPLWRGDPLMADGKAVFLSVAAISEFPEDATLVYLGTLNGVAHFAIDASSASDNAIGAPFAEIGEYTQLRYAAGALSKDEIAIIGHARWLFEWHRKHTFCANCGALTLVIAGGAKRKCETCEAEHFPRTDPVAIVLAVHNGACLLGRNPKFPPGFVSALAGYIEPAETPEEAAKRELFEEAGVILTDVRYQFSQPWPFTTSLMMGFIADAQSRDLTLDQNEIAEAHWVDLEDMRALINGEERLGIFLPPKFTIARQLIDRWAQDKA